jgi:Transglutaminase-like superfamily
MNEHSVASSRSSRWPEPRVRPQDFYAEAGSMTSVEQHRALVDDVPGDVRQVVSIVQSLAIYDVVTADFYGVEMPDDRQQEIHLRPVGEMLARIVGAGAVRLADGLPPAARLACRCRDYSVLTVALLRARGIPARVRCAFGAYFNPGHYEDHQVCEYWNGSERRWKLVDAQLDDVWRERLGIDFDVFDVSRDEFLVAGNAWQCWRSGDVPEDRFGISFAGLHGAWFIAGSVVRDVAALNKVEMLPWDVWGAQPAPDTRLDAEQLVFFDELAELTLDADACFPELRQRFLHDDRLRVPPTVHNALRDRAEQVVVPA